MSQPAHRHFSMIRDFHLADLFTLGNAACGAAAVLAALSFIETGQRALLLVAVALGPLAFLCDTLDGRVARWRRKASLMGRELDSLADVISFGVAPAAIAYAAGLRGGWDRAALIFFVACGVSRLARFNATADALSAGGDKVTHFEGTPITISLLLTLGIGVAALLGHPDLIAAAAVKLGPFALHPAALLYLVTGCLMVSRTIRIPKI